MEFRNREGTAVDPIPFLVTASTAFLLLFSFAPGYLLSLGVTVRTALLVTAAAFGATLLCAYHRMVHTADPTRREEVPGPVRFRRLVYGVLAAIAAMLLLLIPVVAG